MSTHRQVSPDKTPPDKRPPESDSPLVGGETVPWTAQQRRALLAKLAAQLSGSLPKHFDLHDVCFRDLWHD